MRSQSGAKGEPEAAIAAENDEREGVAQDKFENAGEGHQEAAKEVICAANKS